MATKQIDMILNVVAKYSGAAFSKLHSAIAKIEQSTRRASTSFKSLALAAGAVVLGFKGLQGIGDFFRDGIKAAEQTRAINEKLAMSLARNPKLAKMGTATVTDQYNKLLELADQMEKAGGIASASLVAGFTGLTKAGFGPAAIKQHAAAFQDLTVAMTGTAGSVEQVAAVAGSVQRAIKTGLIRPFVTAGLVTKAQVKAFSKLTTETQRAKFMMDLMGRQTGKTAAFMESSAGKIWRTQQIWSNIRENIGTPFITTQLVFAEAMGKVGAALEPVSKQIAEKLTPAFKKFGEWIEKQTPLIDKFGGVVADAFEWIIDNAPAIATALGAIAAGFAAFTIINTLINPITWVVIGLALLSAAIIWCIKNWDKLGPAVQNVWDTVLMVIDDAVQGILDMLSSVVEATESVWKPLVEPLKRLWAEVEPLLKIFGDNVKKFFTTDLPKSLEGIGKQVSDNISKSFKFAAPAIDTAFAAWKDLATWISTNVLAPVINKFADLVHAIRIGKFDELFSEWFRDADAAVRKLIEQIAKIFLDLPKSVGQAVSGVTAALTGPFQSAYNTIMALFGTIATAIGTAITSFQQLGEASKANLHLETGSGAKAAAAAVANRPTGVKGGQHGGLVSSPTMMALAEKGIPEMIIPLRDTTRSRSLLGAAAEGIGMGGAMRGGGGAMNIHTPINITVNGVASGQEGAVAREVERAMQDPIKQLLEQLRRAKAEERRTAYV